jgi:hypothetical protein
MPKPEKCVIANEGLPQLPHIPLPIYTVYVVIMICRDLPPSRSCCFADSACLPIAHRLLGKHD